MKLTYPAIFTPCEELTGYTVEFPDLPGCVTEGRSLSDAMDMAADAASGWILDEMEDGSSYPGPSDIRSVSCPSGSFVSLVLLDMDSYAEKYSTKTIRKNITIPAWLNTYGEKCGLNFSKVLQDALVSYAQADQGR